MKPFPSHRPPPLLLSTFVMLLLTVVWAYLRLFLFSDSALPLTFVLPLLACVWSQRRWHVWTMSAIFTAMAALKSFRLLPDAEWTSPARWRYFLATETNIVVGAAAVALILLYRSRLEERNALVTAQNAELETQAEELSQQNEEIKAQSEELAQQNEEIESQGEELARQNEELQTINDRLLSREDVLEGLLQSARQPEKAQFALRETCQRALAILGAPAETVAILELNGETLDVHVAASALEPLDLPASWPLAGSLVGTVLQQGKSAYVFDLRERPDLAAPFGVDGAVRSLLVAPLRFSADFGGVLVACSHRPTHWTQEQFRMLEWISAQCGLIMEGLRWQKQLRARSLEVEAANRAKDAFLAMLSHELRTPLTPVLAAAGALAADENLSAEVRETLGMIRRNVNIQARLIDDLLDLTRIERGLLDLSPQVLDVNDLLRESAAIVAPHLDAKEQTLSLAAELPAGCAINGDSARLQQVFWNLLRNAIKFSPPRSQITLSAHVTPEPGPQLVATVTDHGIGLDGSDLDRIFRPFEQAAKGPRRTSDSGLGLGLSIAKALVELHAGEIRAHSDGLGRGCRFVVKIPVMKMTEVIAGRHAPVQQPAAAEGAGSTWKILLVEDHADTGKIISWLLKSAGHAVELATTAAAAIELAAAHSFELVISDLGLPDESGIALMRKLRARHPMLRGLCMSGYGMEDDLAACREAGFDEHLTKPVDLQQLHSAIARVMCDGRKLEAPARSETRPSEPRK